MKYNLLKKEPELHGEMVGSPFTIIILSALFAPQTINHSGDKQISPKPEQVQLTDSKSEPPPPPAFGRDLVKGRRSGKATWRPKGKVRPNRRLVSQGGSGAD